MRLVGTRRVTRRGRIGAGAALVVIALVAIALPAFGHASFPAAAAFGFEPNTMGGTGLPGSTPPYVAASTPTIWARVPFEQTELYNGSDDTTVDVKIIVPDEWSNPVCGEAKTQINDATTNFTNQPGVVAGTFECETYFSMGHDVIHFWGPQVVSPATAADSAQFFSFQVTTPSPALQTTYNGTGGTEGYIVDQVYASGHTAHWIPHLDYEGNPPPGSETIVAGGLARTVAAPADVDPCADGGDGPFPDVSADSLFCEDIDWMATEGIAGGFGDGTFRPLNDVSRQAMAGFLYRYADEPPVTLTEPAFDDVPDTNTFYDAIQWMAEEDLATGTPGPGGTTLFNPTGKVSRQVMAAFMYRYAGEPTVTLTEPFFGDVPDGHAFYDPIQWMAESGLSVGTPVPGGDPLYKPLDIVTRQVMSAFIHRYDVEVAP